MSKLIIDLSGPDGNAYVLLGYAKSLCDTLDFNYEEISKEAKSKDYPHLVEYLGMVFEEYLELTNMPGEEPADEEFFDEDEGMIEEMDFSGTDRDILRDEMDDEGYYL